MRSPKSDISSEIGDDTDESESLTPSPNLPFASLTSVFFR